MDLNSAVNMGYSIILFFMSFPLDLTGATEVQLSNAWKPDFGWQVTCSWILFSNDSLQSVRLYSNYHQFLIYRPETDGQNLLKIFRRLEDTLEVVCEETKKGGLEGKCVLTEDMHQPQRKNLTFTCEVSGERPLFIIDKKMIVIEAFVTPTDAIVEATSRNEQTNHVVLNCTSSGVPTPNLVWTIGDQKVPHDFTDSYWNATSKLWHTWSQLSFTPTNGNPPPVCTPEVSQYGRLNRGKSAAYTENAANRIIDTGNVFILLLAILLR